MMKAQQFSRTLPQWFNLDCARDTRAENTESNTGTTWPGCSSVDDSARIPGFVLSRMAAVSDAQSSTKGGRDTIHPLCTV
ncbi:hypothetical protein [Rhodococcus sp. NPDC058521]|uniref:hypothetical protein n=1 Tax=Rhodococcus sp. NPDC058521 TaxID=3346536 RepID=UPI003659434C